jgi:hypothetical protein
MGDIMLVVKVCEWCGSEFETEGWKKQKYCSKKCGHLGAGRKRANDHRIKVEKFIVENTNKHLCGCGCDEYIVITEEHYPDGIPEFIQHHYCTMDAAKEIVKLVHTGKDMSQKTRDMIGIAKKGKTYRKGATNTQEHNKKIANALAGNTNASGAVFTAERCKNISDGIKNFYVNNPGIYHGANSPNWKGGISFEPYCKKFTNELKQQVRDLYNNCDFISGLPDYVCNVLNGKVWGLDIHHIDGNKNQGCDDVEWKLIPLSRCNHSRINGSISIFWEKLICYALEYDETYYVISDDEISEFNGVFNV